MSTSAKTALAAKATALYRINTDLPDGIQDTYPPDHKPAPGSGTYLLGLWRGGCDTLTGRWPVRLDQATQTIVPKSQAELDAERDKVEARSLALAEARAEVRALVGWTRMSPAKYRDWHRAQMEGITDLADAKKYLDTFCLDAGLAIIALRRAGGHFEEE